MEKTMGGWAFVIGLILAAIIAIFGIEATWPMYLLLVLGLIVGILNVVDKEVNSFLIAAVAFMFTFTALSSVVIEIPVAGVSLARFFVLINAFIAPAAAIVAFKALFAHSKN
jgi:hypothetical protein